VWFAGGLRILDVADPHLPKEVGHFMPQPVTVIRRRRATRSTSIPEG
jgi:hypothetical protein